MVRRPSFERSVLCPSLSLNESKFATLLIPSSRPANGWFRGLCEVSLVGIY